MERFFYISNGSFSGGSLGSKIYMIANRQSSVNTLTSI